MWFDDQAEEAANFYVSVFKNSKVREITRYTGEEPVGTKGSVMTVVFELDGPEFVALNGGPRFKFTEAVSFVVNCETQDEIDYYWEKLTSGGGEEVQCGWLTDKYGLSWQVVPAKIGAWARDAAGFQRVMRAIMPMKKLEIAALRRAYDGKLRPNSGKISGCKIPASNSRLSTNRGPGRAMKAFASTTWIRFSLAAGSVSKPG